ncbi:MAG TPA: hypothetical protein VJ761_13665 [Ktedonobacteraceae bacterium]|nr:hypothetical protein [Ktedonobacteraceae bacterium]
MTGYIGNDGSALAGGLNPSSQVQGLAVDATGRLQTANYINGAAVGVSTPYPSADQSRFAAVQDKAFAANYGRLTVAAQTTNGYPLSVFNSGASKDIVIISVRVYANGTAAEFRLALTTSDPAYGSAGSVFNLKAGSATASVANVTYTASASLAPTTFLDSLQLPSNTPGEFIPNGSGIYLPKGSANGLTVWSIPTTSGASIVVVRYIEY